MAEGKLAREDRILAARKRTRRADTTDASHYTKELEGKNEKGKPQRSSYPEGPVGATAYDQHLERWEKNSPPTILYDTFGLSAEEKKKKKRELGRTLGAQAAALDSE